jgi:hypothetical protein
MTGRRCAVVSCLLLAVTVMPVCWAADATLPDAVRQATTAAAVKDQVEKFVKEQVAKLTSDDLAAVQAAREAIFAEVVQPPGKPPLSAAFLDVYCETLNDALKDAAKDKRPQVRLNVAVLVARVGDKANAEKATNTRLMPLVVVLLGDENQAIVLWAVKASRGLVPAVLNNVAIAKNNPLIPALVAAAKKHAKYGPIVQAAYVALDIQDKGPNSVLPAQWAVAVPVVADAIVEIMLERIKLFDRGVPMWSAAEGTAIHFLTRSDIWRAKLPADAAQKLHLRTVQATSDLIGVAGQRVQAAGNERGELYNMLKTGAAGLLVNDEKLKADDTLKKLHGITNTTPNQVVIPLCQQVYPVLKAVPEFKDLKPPPQLSEAPPTPATTGSSGPAAP